MPPPITKERRDRRFAILVSDIPSSVPMTALAALAPPNTPVPKLQAFACSSTNQVSTYSVIVPVHPSLSKPTAENFLSLYSGRLSVGRIRQLLKRVRGSRILLSNATSVQDVHHSPVVRSAGSAFDVASPRLQTTQHPAPAAALPNSTVVVRSYFTTTCAPAQLSDFNIPIAVSEAPRPPVFLCSVPSTAGIGGSTPTFVDPSVVAYRQTLSEVQILGRYNLRQLSGLAQKLFAKVFSLADRLARGTYQWYPPFPSSLHLEGAQVQWINRRSKHFLQARGSIPKLQLIADSFSHEFSIARMHGSFFLSRIRATSGISQEIRDKVEVADLSWEVRRYISPVLRRIVSFMYLMPSESIHPDFIHTVQQFSCHIWVRLLSHAIWTECNLAVTDTSILAHARHQIQLLQLPEHQQRLWDDFENAKLTPLHTTVLVAAGGRPTGPVLPQDRPWFDCAPRTTNPFTAPPRESIPDWTRVPIPYPASVAQRPTQGYLFESGRSPEPGCVVRVRGHFHSPFTYSATFDLAQGNLFTDLMRGMSPSPNPRLFPHSLFRWVRPVRVQFRPLPLAPHQLEVEFWFSSRSHAVMASLRFGLWKDRLKLQNPVIVNLDAECGEFHPLSALACTIVVRDEQQLPNRLAIISCSSQTAQPVSVCVTAQRNCFYDLVIRYSSPSQAASVVSSRLNFTADGDESFSSPLTPHIPLDAPVRCGHCGKLGHTQRTCTEAAVNWLTGTCPSCFHAGQVEPVFIRCIGTSTQRATLCNVSKAVSDNTKVLRDDLLSNWERLTIFGDVQRLTLGDSLLITTPF